MSFQQAVLACFPQAMTSDEGIVVVIPADLIFSLSLSVRFVSFSTMIYILRIDSEVPPVFSDMSLIFISFQRFPHIECIFASIFTRGVVAVVIYYSSIDAVPIVFRHASASELSIALFMVKPM